MFAKSLIAVLLTIPYFAWSQTEYTVREGDTLLKIADKSLGTSDKKDPRRYEYAKNLVKLNPNLKNPNALVPGQTILLPGNAPSLKDAAAVESAAPLNPPKISSLKPVAIAAAVIAAQPEPQVATPSPTPAPTPAPAIHEMPPHASTSTEAAHHNLVFVQPRYQSVKLTSEEEATHTEATMNSKSSIGFDLQYIKVVNGRWHLIFQAGLTSTQFGEIEDNIGTVNHKSETLKSFAMGAAYEVTPRLHMDVMAMYKEQSFLLPGTTAGEYKLESVAFPGVELNISWDMYSGSQNIFGLSAIGEYLGNATKDTVEFKSILEPSGALYWKSNLGPDRMNYKVTFSYKNGHQETSVNKKKEALSTLGLGFYF